LCAQSKTEAELTALHQTHTQTRSELSHALTHSQTLATTHQQTLDALHSSTQQRLQALEREYEQKVVAVTTEAKSVQQSLQSQLEQSEKRCAAEQATVHTLRAELQAQTQVIAELRAELSAAQQSLSSAQTQVSDALKQHKQQWMHSSHPNSELKQSPATSRPTSASPQTQTQSQSQGQSQGQNESESEAQVPSSSAQPLPAFGITDPALRVDLNVYLLRLLLSAPKQSHHVTALLHCTCLCSAWNCRSG
jgi:hypothetical protein